MGKKQPGPEGPDQEHEPRKIAPSDAAHERAPINGPIHVHDNKCAGDAESGNLDALDQYLPSGPIVYDSGWLDMPGNVAVRVVFAGGPSNEGLRAWGYANPTPAGSFPRRIHPATTVIRP